MIQYKTVLNINISQMNLFLPSKNSTIETISKQLEYVTKGHVATQTILLQAGNYNNHYHPQNDLNVEKIPSQW